MATAASPCPSSPAKKWCCISTQRTTPRAAPPRPAGFATRFPDYGGTGAVVIGISKDSVASHDKFKKKHEFAVYPRLRCSTAKSVRSMAPGSRKSMYGRKYMGIDRSHISDRRIGRSSATSGKGQGAGPRRRSAEGGARPLTPFDRVLTAGAVAILATADPAGKAAASRSLAADWAKGPGDRRCCAADRGRRGRIARYCARRGRCRSGANFGSLAGPHRAAARAGPYRAERDRSRLGHRRAVRGQALPRAFFDDWVGRCRRGGRAFRAAGCAACRFRRAVRRSAGP